MATQQLHTPLLHSLVPALRHGENTPTKNNVKLPLVRTYFLRLDFQLLVERYTLLVTFWVHSSGTTPPLFTKKRIFKRRTPRRVRELNSRSVWLAPWLCGRNRSAIRTVNPSLKRQNKTAYEETAAYVFTCTAVTTYQVCRVGYQRNRYRESYVSMVA